MDLRIKVKRRRAVASAVLILAIFSAGGCGKDAQTRDARILEFTYEFSVTNVPETSTNVIAWAPLPVQHCFQEVRGLEIETDYPHTIVSDSTYSNRIVRFDFSDNPARTNAERSAAITFGVLRSSYNVLEGDMSPELVPHLEKKVFLKPSTNIPLEGKIAEEARTVAGDVKDPLQRARKLYDHIVTSVEYDKSGKGWGRGNAVYACNIRKGNCTDFHSLFMAEARVVDIPARFIIGFPLPDDPEDSIGGYHCWAEAYIEGTGWIPVDASEANKHPEKKKELFGGLDANRVEFTLGREIELPGAKGAPLNFFIYPYVEVDGKGHDGISKTFTFSRGLPE